MSYFPSSSDPSDWWGEFHSSLTFPWLRISSLETLSLAVHDLEDLLLLQKPALPAPTLPANNSRHSTSSTVSQLEPYNRSRYHSYSKDTKKAFGELYLFCFTLAKPPYVPFTTACPLSCWLDLRWFLRCRRQGRNIDMEVIIFYLPWFGCHLWRQRSINAVTFLLDGLRVLDSAYGSTISSPPRCYCVHKRMFLRCWCHTTL